MTRRELRAAAIVPLEPRKRGANRSADIEARAVAAVVTFALPAHVARQLVNGIEFTTFDETLCQAKRHRGVVGPFPRLQVEWATAEHVVYGLERSGGTKLERRAQCVAGR